MQGKDLGQWDYAYFLTAPAVNGNANNPLAYWYLYDASKHLTAMILQLDTSYGDRRMWFVENTLPKDYAGLYRFRGCFVKDLQVSPFMPLGQTTYQVDSTDPCDSKDDTVRILVKIKHGEETMMVTSVSPRGAPLDISTAGFSSALYFVLRWWWVPMSTVVVTRILSQAAKIYLRNRKAITLATRPEPPPTTVAKPARTPEM